MGVFPPRVPLDLTVGKFLRSEGETVSPTFSSRCCSKSQKTAQKVGGGVGVQRSAGRSAPQPPRSDRGPASIRARLPAGWKSAREPENTHFFGLKCEVRPLRLSPLVRFRSVKGALSPARPGSERLSWLKRSEVKRDRLGSREESGDKTTVENVGVLGSVTSSEGWSRQEHQLFQESSPWRVEESGREVPPRPGPTGREEAWGSRRRPRWR